MKKNSIIEKPLTYVSPSVVEMAFDSEGLLCQSRIDGAGNEDFGWGDDVDFF